jgi:hypothetical protein
MKSIRQLHFYLGIFFAPTIIFFAFSGALQTFSLHENKEPGSNNPAWIAKLAEIHKDQYRPQFGAEPAQAQPKPAEVEARPNPAPTPKRTPARAPRHKSVPLKIFVVLMAAGLMLSSCLGIYMAFKYNRDRRIIWSLLVAGTVLPIALLFL